MTEAATAIEVDTVIEVDMTEVAIAVVDTEDRFIDQVLDGVMTISVGADRLGVHRGTFPLESLTAVVEVDIEVQLAEITMATIRTTTITHTDHHQLIRPMTRPCLLPAA